MSDPGVAIATFTAVTVEAVEAASVLLAVGLTRGWRSVTQGTLTALILLTAVVAAVGSSLTAIPLTPLRLVIGTLMIYVGVTWLRKAVLRASGRKALHDERAIFTRERDAAGRVGMSGRYGVRDWYGFVVAFKATAMEGTEVAVIVAAAVALGHARSAVLAASVAVLTVTLTAVALRAPLVRVPENGLKYAVGCLLLTYGTFWLGEGVGVSWPMGDAVLPVLLLTVAAMSWFAVTILRVRPTGATTLTSAMRFTADDIGKRVTVGSDEMTIVSISDAHTATVTMEA